MLKVPKDRRVMYCTYHGLSLGLLPTVVMITMILFSDLYTLYTILFYVCDSSIPVYISMAKFYTSAIESRGTQRRPF